MAMGASTEVSFTQPGGGGYGGGEGREGGGGPEGGCEGGGGEAGGPSGEVFIQALEHSSSRADKFVCVATTVCVQTSFNASGATPPGSYSSALKFFVPYLKVFRQRWWFHGLLAIAAGAD